jgi:hypothetical protein
VIGPLGRDGAVASKPLSTIENGGYRHSGTLSKTHQQPSYGFASLTQGPFRVNPALNRLIARKLVAPVQG